MEGGKPPKGQLADQWPCYVIPEGTGRFWKPWKFERNIPPHGDSAMLYRWIGSNNLWARYLMENRRVLKWHGFLIESILKNIV